VVGGASDQPLIEVYVITFRRAQLLKRALSSVLNQTYPNILVKVINDDPEDSQVSDVISQLGDPRVSLFLPVERRGATRNFNLPFEHPRAPFVAILEDDNWWEPTFLEEMMAALSSHPDVQIAVGNELVWEEMNDGSWRNTQRRIWDLEGLQLYHHTPEQLCGSAKLCNSSTLFRTNGGTSLKIPETLPVDVTEHFRERLLTPPILLLGKPLVNFAQTLQTARSRSGSLWTQYQCILIGSMFISLRDRTARSRLAQRLWQLCPSRTSPRAVSLVMTGILLPEARALVSEGSGLAVVRFLAWAAKHPWQFLASLRLRRRYRQQLDFLVNAPLTQNLAKFTSASGS
jgi:hypothetical protein